MKYPEEWNQLPKRERRKKIKGLKRKKAKQQAVVKKLRNAVLVFVIIAVVVTGYRFITQKTPEEIVFEQKVDEISLEGKVEEFEIEGTSHVGLGETVSYNTNPPTSGSHYAQSANWGFNDKELPDEQLVHNLEHGGIWISYRNADENTLEKLKDIARRNSESVVITERTGNDDPIVVVSWGRMMRLAEVDEALIRKFVDIYINQSPEKLAR